MPTDLSTPSGSPFVVQIDRSEASQGRWVVDAAIRVEPRAHAAASNDDRSNDDRGSVSVPYSLRRVYQLHPAPPALPRKVLVNDTKQLEKENEMVFNMTPLENIRWPFMLELP